MEKINIATVIALGVIVDAVSQTAKVALADQDGNIAYGHARHIVNSKDNFGLLGYSEDIRDGFLRITLRSGLETAVSVRTLVTAHQEGRFAIYDW